MNLKSQGIYSSIGLGVALARCVSVFIWLTAFGYFVLFCTLLETYLDLGKAIPQLAAPAVLAVISGFVGWWTWVNAPKFGKSFAGEYEDDDNERVAISGALILEGVVGSFGVLRVASAAATFLPMFIAKLSGPDASAPSTGSTSIYNGLVELLLGAGMVGWAVWSAKRAKDGGEPAAE